MAVPVRVGDHLARVCEAMRVTHDRVCRRTLAGQQVTHRWESCPTSPSLFAAGDALDLLDMDATADQIASALHARMCQDPECGIAEAREHALRAYAPTARAMVDWYREAHPPEPGAEPWREPCECSHVLRGHSPDGRRCLTPACPCGAQGGFRPLKLR